VPGSDTADCAYDYGWNAAADSYRTATSAYVSLGLASPGATRTPSPNVWWLDVEIINSWRTDVTRGSSDFSAYPSWVAGASSPRQAVGICSAKGFTGGRVALVQYLAGGFDADLLCQSNGG
jgi:hypothetical protein